MAVMVAVPDSPEGVVALAAAVAEAERLGTRLIVVDLGLRPIDRAAIGVEATLVEVTVVERSGRGHRDPVDVVLDELTRHDDVDRLVIGLKRRTPVGKLILGSVSQGLLLRSPVPVLAVKP